MTRTLIAALLLCSVEALGQIGSCLEDPLNRPVPRFEVSEAGIFDAILRLGHESGTSMSVMGWGLDLFEKRVTVTALDSTVGRVLADILRPLPAARIDQTDNVVTMNPYALLPPPWLDYQVQGVTGARIPMQSASLALFMRVRSIEDPSITGFAGTNRPGDSDDLVEPFADEFATVRSNLNHVVCTSSQGGLWVVHETPLEELFVGGTRQRYWTVLGYSEGLDVNLRIAQWRRGDLGHRKTPGR